MPSVQCIEFAHRAESHPTEAGLYAINAKTGAILWQASRFDYSGGFSSPTVANGMVYFAAIGTDFTGYLNAFGLK